jgi:hypothetical protein
VTKRSIAGRDEDAGVAQATLVCEIERYIDAEFHAERKASAAVSSVSVRVWGSQ